MSVSVMHVVLNDGREQIALLILTIAVPLASVLALHSCEVLVGSRRSRARSDF